MNSLDDAKQSGLVALLEFLKLIPPPQEIANAVDKLRAKYPNASAEELARRIVDKATWMLTGAGVVASLPSAIPGLGTALEFGILGVSITGETWLILRNLTAMQLMIAGIYDHVLAHPERQDEIHSDRKNEIIIVWGLVTGAVVPAKEAVKRVGTKIAVEQFNQRVSGKLLQRINQELGTTVLTKWGAKRGGIVLGRLIPVGVGVVIGGGMNYAATRSFGAACLRLYTEILPNNDEVFVLE